jgi:prevent-host-death family protein
MTKVNMLEAKTNLSRLVEAVESGREPEIILARNGKPVARIVPIEQPRRIVGIADGQFGELDDDWFRDFKAASKDIQEVMDARWERFERHTRELEATHGKRKRKKSA